MHLVSYFLLLTNPAVSTAYEKVAANMASPVLLAPMESKAIRPVITPFPPLRHYNSPRINELKPEVDCSRRNCWSQGKRRVSRIAAIDADLVSTTVTQQGRAAVTWEISVGAIGGFLPWQSWKRFFTG
ncbi:hypothetical protein LINGRAHAP2_LOCUS3841 [Linum grandiflorum]